MEDQDRALSGEILECDMTAAHTLELENRGLASWRQHVTNTRPELARLRVVLPPAGAPTASWATARRRSTSARVKVLMESLYGQLRERRRMFEGEREARSSWGGQE
jgi:hypothetical protein